MTRSRYWEPKTGVGVTILTNGDWSDTGHRAAAIDNLNEYLFTLFASTATPHRRLRVH
jgi:hypothetical protein